MRRVTSCPSVSPLSPFPDLSSFFVNNRLFRPTTVSKNPPILFPPCARTRFSPSPHPAGSTSYLLLPSLPSSPRWSSLLLHPGCPSRPFCPVSLEPPGTLWVSPPCLLNRPFRTCGQRLGFLFLVRGSEHRVFVLRPSLLRRFLCSSTSSFPYTGPGSAAGCVASFHILSFGLPSFSFPGPFFLLCK